MQNWTLDYQLVCCGRRTTVSHTYTSLLIHEFQRILSLKLMHKHSRTLGYTLAWLCINPVEGQTMTITHIGLTKKQRFTVRERERLLRLSDYTRCIKCVCVCVREGGGDTGAWYAKCQRIWISELMVRRRNTVRARAKGISARQRTQLAPIPSKLLR